MANTVDIEKLLDGIGRTLAQALAAKWPLIGIQAGTVAQDQAGFVQSAIWEGDLLASAACNTLVDAFIDKVKAGVGDRQAVVLHQPESGVHTVGHEKDKIGAYCRVMLGFIIERNQPAAGSPAASHKGGWSVSSTGAGTKVSARVGA